MFNWRSYLQYLYLSGFWFQVMSLSAEKKSSWERMNACNQWVNRLRPQLVNRWNGPFVSKRTVVYWMNVMPHWGRLQKEETPSSVLVSRSSCVPVCCLQSRALSRSSSEDFWLWDKRTNIVSLPQTSAVNIKQFIVSCESHTGNMRRGHTDGDTLCKYEMFLQKL